MSYQNQKWRSACLSAAWDRELNRTLDGRVLPAFRGTHDIDVWGPTAVAVKYPNPPDSLAKRIRRFIMGEEVGATAAEASVALAIIFERGLPLVGIQRAIARRRRVTPGAVSRLVSRVEAKIARALGEAVRLVAFRTFLLKYG